MRALSLFAALPMMVPVASALGATGTPATTISRPSGKAPLRYRDVITHSAYFLFDELGR